MYSCNVKALSIESYAFPFLFSSFFLLFFFVIFFFFLELWRTRRRPQPGLLASWPFTLQGMGFVGFMYVL